MLKTNLLLAITLLVSHHLIAQSRPAIDKEALTQLLYNHVSDETPGLAMGIVQDGQIIYEQYVGYANLEHEVKIDEHTRFNIASDAKQFTALCILKLAEEGKLDVNDDFRTYLPYILPDIPEKITITNLLNHTSGIRDYCDLISLTGKTWWKELIGNDDVMDMMRTQRDLNFEPGSAFLYSNTNYILLAEIVKKITGKPFADYAENLFASLDMPNTVFQNDDMQMIPHKASPYGNWGEWKSLFTITEVHGDGALYTTLRDQLKWEQILQENNGDYLSKTLIEKSQSPLEPSFKGFYGNAYGYGLMFDTYKGLEYTYHSGSTGAYNATYIRIPESNMALVIMTNQFGVIAENIGWEFILPMYGITRDQQQGAYPNGPKKVEKLKRISDVLGVYQSEDGSVIKITEKEGSLVREMYQREPDRLMQEKGGLFAYSTIEGLKMNFEDIGQPEQRFTLYRSSQAPNTFKKLANLDFDGLDRSTLNGRYVNEETDTEIIIQHEEGDTYTITKNGRERTSKLVSPDLLRMMDVYFIKVMRDEAGAITGLNVDRDRIQNVVFEKR